MTALLSSRDMTEQQSMPQSSSANCINVNACSATSADHARSHASFNTSHNLFGSKN